MRNDMLWKVLRRGSRVSAVAVGLALGLAATPALAAPPTAWQESQVSGFRLLAVIVLIPLAAIAVITLLVFLPSLVKGQKSEPALAFQQRSEWFGGPRSGVDATVGAPGKGPGPEAEAGTGKGGASARW